MENWSLATMYCISSLPNPLCLPFLSLFFIRLDEQHGVWKCSKTNYPLQTRRRIIHPQPQRPSSLAGSTRPDHIRPCTCVCNEASEKKQMKTASNFASSFKSICVDFWPTITCSIHLFSSTPAQNHGQRFTGRTTRALNTDGWQTTQIKVAALKSRVLFCLRMDTLNGMCVNCLWVSERFFCSRLFEDNLHSRKTNPLFFVPIVTVFQGRALCLKGYY